MKRTGLLIMLSLCVSLLPACAQYESKRGVEVNWQSDVTDKLTKGESTRANVLALLGPPSQVISLDGETALYYLFEQSQGDGLILLVYNRMRVDTRYDRAIFFFNEHDVLTEYSTRIYTADEG
jgi:outer membrane protein assembly factor BamE (lipoprotein component of BamABCDE complex)